MRLLRPLLLLGAVVGATALLAGCAGSSADVPAPVADLASVATASQKAGSVAFDLSVKADVLGQDLAITANGAFDDAGHRGRMTLDLSALAALGQAFGGGSADMPAELANPESWKMDVLVDGTRVYLHFPLLRSKLGGREWITGDARELAKAQGVDLGQLGSAATSDPRSALDALKAVSGPLTTVGREDVDGVSTTHYRASLDPAKIVDQAAAGGASGDLLSSMRQALAQANVSSVPLDVWVGDDGLLRKLVFDVSVEQAGQKAGASFEMRLHDYGEPVTFDLPQANEVVDASTLQR